MYFDSFEALLQMGKHGFYVWSAWGSTALVLLLSWLSARAGFNGAARRLQQQLLLSEREAQQPSMERNESP